MGPESKTCPTMTCFCRGNTHVCFTCGSGELEMGSGELGEVCTSCGAVSSETEFAGSQGAENDESDLPDWTNHYTVSNSTERQLASAFAFPLRNRGYIL